MLIVKRFANTPPVGDTYWSSVSLLLNTTNTNDQTNNVFLDSSTNNFSITNNAVVQGTFSPFAVASNTAYSPSVNGGSAYFNGTTQSLSIPSDDDFAYGTGDFTWEFWINRSGAGGANQYIMNFDGAAQNGVISYFNGTLRYYNSSTGIGSALYATNIELVVGTWYHVAISRQSETTRIFVNGIQVASGADSHNYGSAPLTIGVYAGGGLAFNGYLSSLRVVKGTALYTDTFTPSTTALAAIAGTSLLLNFTNAGMFDAAANINLASVGDVKVSTAQAKFAPTSVFFDGTGDSLQALSSEILYPTISDDFTAEMWVYPSSAQANAIFMGFESSTVAGPWVLRIASSTLEIMLGDITITAGTVTAEQWNHIAFTKSGSTVKLFLNGVQQGSEATVTSIIAGSTNFTIGDWTNGGRAFNGHIQDARITKGIARYTGNFTPPTTAFAKF